MLLVVSLGEWINISLWEKQDDKWICSEAFGKIKEEFQGKNSEDVRRIIEDNQWNYKWLKPSQVEEVDICLPIK